MACFDASDLLSGWQATLSATRHHLRWLGAHLSAGDIASGSSEPGDGPLFLLAQSIGAGADLLATQNRSTSGVMDDDVAVRGARSEVAAIAWLGARAAMTRLVSGQLEHGASTGLFYEHLIAVLGELDSLREVGVREVGGLGGLATRLPRGSVDELSRICRLAAEWQVAHEGISPRVLLTRDLRSTTSQLRTVAGYLAHVAGLLHQAGDAESTELTSLAKSARAAAAAQACVSQAWRTRLSDLNGRSDAPAEAAFLHLLDGLKRWLCEGDRLKRPDEVVGGIRSVRTIRGVVDELAYSGHQVASHHEESVRFLIQAGSLFVPKFELAKRDPEFIAQPSIWHLRYRQPAWVRTTRASCFDQLTSALAEATGHFADAASTSRQLAGTTHQRRPVGPDFVTEPRVLPPPRWNRQFTDEALPTTDDERFGIDR